VAYYNCLLLGRPSFIRSFAFAAMETKCADVVKDLHNYVSSTDWTNNLPISVTENDVCDLNPADSLDSLENDTTSVPLSVAACDIAVTPATARVQSGQPAIFHVGLNGSTPLHERVIESLASSAVVHVSLHVHVDGVEIVTRVPADIEASVEFNCALVIVAVPTGTPNGSLVTINCAWVAGSAVVLSTLSSSVVIGFNHAPAPAGAMLEAAKAGDLSGVRTALDNGESTAQKDMVSAGDGELVRAREWGGVSSGISSPAANCITHYLQLLLTTILWID
jgi:hypothetical protein